MQQSAPPPQPAPPAAPAPTAAPALPAPDLYKKRLALYRKIEKARGSRVLAFVTGDRPGMPAQIDATAVDLFEDHLDAVFPTKIITLILYTRGGNTLAAWNLVTMLRMFCDELEIFVPNKARSAGTLMCLGADKIVMTKQATLGPIDPSLTGPLNPQIPGGSPEARAPVGVEAVKGYLEMAKHDFGVKDSEDMARVLVDFAARVHPLVLGGIFRSKTQIQFLARELLKMQVKDGTKTKKIIDFLCSESGSHDYTINRREAKALGLNVEVPSEALYELLRSWLSNVREDLSLAVPFDANSVLGANAAGTYRCVRCLIESTAAPASIFVSEGELRKIQVQHPQFGMQEAINDTRTFEGWRPR